MENFKTKVELLNVLSGTKVTHDPEKDNIGKTGKLLCGVPQGGSLFYSRDDLEKVE